MKGLEQAVNIKLWPGNGEPVKAWGRLKRVRAPQLPSARRPKEPMNVQYQKLTIDPRILISGMKAVILRSFLVVDTKILLFGYPLL